MPSALLTSRHIVGSFGRVTKRNLKDNTVIQTDRFALPGTGTQIGWSIASLSLCAMTAFAEIERSATANMIGFTAANAAQQQALETKFDARLDPADQRAWLERMSAEPNHVGSPHNKANADFMLEKFREWGWDAQIETFRA